MKFIRTRCSLLLCVLAMLLFGVMAIRSFGWYDCVSFYHYDTTGAIGPKQVYALTSRPMPSEWQTNKYLRSMRYVPFSRYSLISYKGRVYITYLDDSWIDLKSLAKLNATENSLGDGETWRVVVDSSSDLGGFIDIPSQWRGDDLLFSFLGFSTGHRFDSRLGFHIRGISLPYWSLIVLSIAWPAVHLSRRIRIIYRRRHFLCIVCGYDLRFIPSISRCPECGHDAIS